MGRQELYIVGLVFGKNVFFSKGSVSKNFKEVPLDFTMKRV